jgi:Protein of unknown function (DUF455)
MVCFGPSPPVHPPSLLLRLLRMALDESNSFRSSYPDSPPSLHQRPTAPTLASGNPPASPPTRSARVSLLSTRSMRRAGSTVPPCWGRQGAREHATSGHRWFMWLCHQQGVEPIAAFREEVRRGWRSETNGPFNVEARQTAGLTNPFYKKLCGSSDSAKHDKEEERAAEHPSLQIEYDRSESSILDLPTM